MKATIYHITTINRYALVLAMLLCVLMLKAQGGQQSDSALSSNRTLTFEDKGSNVIQAGTLLSAHDSLLMAKNQKKLKREKVNWNKWCPSPKKATWLAIIFPGAGQIYNRKYWKLPIVYGGFVGCFYALRWNNQMYHDYSNAYLDIMDNNPKTQSYKQFLHFGNQIDETNIDRYKELFRKRKDRYRRWRDMSIFSMIGVYALSIIDAYVDASLSEFDISDDLSLRIEPAVISNRPYQNNIQSNAFGVQCRLTF